MKQYNLLFWFALLGFAFWWIIPLGTYGLFDDGYGMAALAATGHFLMILIGGILLCLPL
jgi:hypothetical protein